MLCAGLKTCLKELNASRHLRGLYPNDSTDMNRGNRARERETKRLLRPLSGLRSLKLHILRKDARPLTTSGQADDRLRHQVFRGSHNFRQR